MLTVRNFCGKGFWVGNAEILDASRTARAILPAPRDRRRGEGRRIPRRPSGLRCRFSGDRPLIARAVRSGPSRRSVPVMVVVEPEMVDVDHQERQAPLVRRAKFQASFSCARSRAGFRRPSAGRLAHGLQTSV